MSEFILEDDSYPIDPHSVYGLPYFIIGWICVSLGVGYLVHQFAHKSSVPRYIFLVVFLGWLLPFSIVYCLPVDLASSKYRACLESHLIPIQACPYPIIYIDAITQRILWQVIYWSLTILTWFFIPILNSYFDCGGFTPLQSLKKAIKYNIWYYAVVGLIGIVFLAYIAVQKKLMNFDSIRAFVMALSSAYGLLLVVVLMGYGLVDIPRSLWQKANRQRSLELLEMKAPRCHEAMELAKQSLDQVQAEIQTLDTFVPIQDPLRRYVDQMLLVCGLNSPRPHASSLASSQRSTVTLKSLQQMHRKLKLAKLNLARKQQKWRSLISAASYYRSVLNPRPTKHLFHSIQVYIFPYVLKTTSVLAMLFSLMIVWSEIAMNWNLSIFQFLSHTSFGVLMWFTLATLVYMAICLYVPLLHIHVFEKYALTQRHTDVGSLLFFAAYLTRLAFPLSYNVIHLLQVDPVFAVYMGNVNLVPLLGDSFHDWVPLGLCVTTFITLGRWQKKLIQAFNLDPGYMDIDDAQCNRIDGHQLIDQALNQYPWHPTNGSSHLLSHHSPPSASFQSTWPSKGSSTALTDMFVPLGKKIHDPNTVTPLKKNLN